MVNVTNLDNPKNQKIGRHQAQGMPFTMPPLSVEFDWAANSITSKLVLEEDYSNSELDFF
eukprot:10486644-Ditylum_brightwellii.AAC.1